MTKWNMQMHKLYANRNKRIGLHLWADSGRISVWTSVGRGLDHAEMMTIRIESLPFPSHRLHNQPVLLDQPLVCLVVNLVELQVGDGGEQ